MLKQATPSPYVVFISSANLRDHRSSSGVAVEPVPPRRPGTSCSSSNGFPIVRRWAVDVRRPRRPPPNSRLDSRSPSAPPFVPVEFSERAWNAFYDAVKNIHRLNCALIPRNLVTVWRRIAARNSGGGEDFREESVGICKRHSLREFSGVEEGRQMDPCREAVGFV